MSETLHFYSAIVLLKQTPSSALISDLQHRIAKRYNGKSTISLPTHITLIRWKSTSSIFGRLKPKIHLRTVDLELNVKSIEISPDHRSIWYKVQHSKSLLQLRDSIYATLLESNTPEGDITLDDQFHITLAYKDYSENTIDKIYGFLNHISAPVFFTLHTKIVVACQRDQDTVWFIVDPLPSSQEIERSVP